MVTTTGVRKYSKYSSIVYRLIALIALSGVLYIARPLFHNFAYRTVYDLTGLVSGVITFVLFLFLFFSPPVKLKSHTQEFIPLEFGDMNERSALSLVVKFGILLGSYIGLRFVIGLVGILYLNPIGWAIAFIIFVILALSTVLSFVYSDKKSQLLLTGLLVLFLLSTWIFWAGEVQEREIAVSAMDRVEMVNDTPQINPENPRIVPLMVDQKQATGTVSYQTHKLGTSDIARGPNGSLYWSYPVVPDGIRNYIFEDQRGVFLSDMTSIDNRTRIAYDSEPDQNFNPGQGLFLSDSAKWNLVKDTYFTRYNDDPVEFVNQGNAYMAYPRTGHEWNVDFAFGFIPMPYTQPTWDGVGLLDTEGNIEQFSPEEARNEPILKGQRLYPLSLTDRYMGTLGYRNGIINQYDIVGSHEGEIEKATIPNDAGNSQPFVVDLKESGFAYATAFEPYGSDTRGLSEVWIIEARTGDFKRIKFREGRDVFGPERALGLVQAEDSRTNWDRFNIVEPVPVFVDNQLYWQTKVVPNDNLAVSRNVFVNAETGEAGEVRTTSKIKSFIAGDIGLEEASQLGNTDTGDSGSNNQSTSNTEIVIEDGDGNVIDTITIPENGTVKIEQGE